MTYGKSPIFWKLTACIALAVVLGGGVWFVRYRHATSVDTTGNNRSTSAGTRGDKASGSFNKNQYSLTDPASIWVVVNKQHPLNPKTYAPTDLVTPNVPLRVPGNETMQLRTVTAKAVESMFAAAKTAGLQLMLSSGYRSYTYQVSLYDGYVQSQGQATADTQSARPGYSEHQTGFALDVEPVSRTCELEQCFGTTPEGKWVAANAYKYGFIVRYTSGNENVTGYEPEPWHIRYIGVELATELHNAGVATLEQFFGVTGGKNYAQ